MVLLKTRPHLRLLLERRLIAGELAVFVIEVDCPKPLAIDRISFSLLGHVVWFTTSQYGRHRHSSRFLAHEVALLADGPDELPAGIHRLVTRLRLGPELPGSWEGDRLAIEYSVAVHVDIPWWPDARVEFAVEVAPAPPVGPPESAIDSGAEPRDPGAVVYASHAGGPPSKGPYLELSLGRQTIQAGAPIQLNAALGNVDRNRYRKLDVAILAQETIPTGLGGQYVHEHVFGRWSVGLDNHPGELQPIPFNLELPRALSPGFELHHCALRWLIAVEADVAWGVNPKLRFPVTVEAGVAAAGELPAPLAVGSDRLRLIWSAVAQASGLSFVEGSLHGRVQAPDGPIAVEVHRSQHAGEARVIGVLEFPSLAVGLRSRRSSRGLLGTAAAVELVARDPAQSQMIAAILAKPIADAPGALVSADDHSLRLALPGAGLELDALRSFSEALLALGARIAALPEQLPPPAVVASAVPAWRRAATKLNASLRLADLQLTLARAGQTLTLTTTYDDDGGLRSTVFELDPGLAIPSRHHLLWTGDFALPSSELALDELATPPRWAELARVAVQIDAASVRLYLPAPLLDPLLERPRIDALFALGRQLRGESLPYR
jgi:hypothetical protein